MDAKRLAQSDQDFELLIANLPRMWWRLYEKLKAEGFNEEQSLRLVIAVIQRPS